MTTCMYCGGQTPDGSKFCEQCGAALPVEAILDQAAPNFGEQQPIDVGYSATSASESVGGGWQNGAPQPPQSYGQPQQQGGQAYQQPYGQPQQPYGQPQQAFAAPVQPAAADSGSIGWGILGAFFPIVGIILFFVWRTSKPKSAKVALIGAAIGFVLGLMSNAFLYAG